MQSFLRFPDVGKSSACNALERAVHSPLSKDTGSGDLEIRHDSLPVRLACLRVGKLRRGSFLADRVGTRFVRVPVLIPVRQPSAVCRLFIWR